MKWTRICFIFSCPRLLHIHQISNCAMSCFKFCWNLLVFRKMPFWAVKHVLNPFLIGNKSLGTIFVSSFVEWRTEHEVKFSRYFYSLLETQCRFVTGTTPLERLAVFQHFINVRHLKSTNSGRKIEFFKKINKVILLQILDIPKSVWFWRASKTFFFLHEYASTSNDLGM